MNENRITKSIWCEEIDLPRFPKLDKSIETEVLVVGGGISGILMAYRLQKAGMQVVLVEKDEIGRKVTEKTTAFITFMQDVLYQTYARKLGFTKAKLYLEANLEAIKEYEKLAKLYNFDFKLTDSYQFSKDDRDTLEKEIKVLKEMGIETKYVDDIPLPIRVMGAIKATRQGEMNPLKLIKELSSELTIYENTEIKEIHNDCALTKDYMIKAKKIVICTHYPIKNDLMYAMKMHQVRSYVVGIEQNNDCKGLYTDIGESGLYFRSYKDMLIIGGNDTKTGKNTSTFKTITNFVRKEYPGKKIKYQWANQDLVTLDNIPYIGKVNMFCKNIYVCTGFNLWGMTNSMIGSMVITDLIMNGNSKYAKLFNPSRLTINKNFFIGLGTIIKNQIGLNKRRCTHLGCILTYNKKERSWDCPCHGSRFDAENGKILNSPAQKPLDLDN